MTNHLAWISNILFSSEKFSTPGKSMIRPTIHQMLGSSAIPSPLYRNIKEFWQVWHYQKFLTGLHNGGLWENIFWSVCQNNTAEKYFILGWSKLYVKISTLNKDGSDSPDFPTYFKTEIALSPTGSGLVTWLFEICNYQGHPYLTWKT